MMPQLEDVLGKVLTKIKPTEDERAQAMSIYENIKKIVETYLSIPYDFKVELHGSVAKGTELRGDIDLDVFVLIRYDEISQGWLEKSVVQPLFEVLKRFYGNVRLNYATHPYIHVDLGVFEVDIVPAYWARDISEIRTAVDRTPFHTKYVISKLSEGSKDEVRLLKAFFKGVGIYGAEIKTEGFSGYLTELLIVKYGKFLKALEAMTSWRAGEVVIVDEDKIKENCSYLRKAFRSPLIVPDPVDPRRNAASAVSLETLAKAVLASHIFLLEPSREFFILEREMIHKEDIERFATAVKESGREAVGIVFRVSGDIAPEVIWGKLKSTARSFMNYVRKSGFTVISYAVWSDETSEAAILVTVQPRELAPYELHLGPPLGKVSDLKAFVAKYRLDAESFGPYVTPDGRIFTLRRRKNVLLYQLAEEYVSTLKGESNFLVSRVLKDLSEVYEFVVSRGDPELVKAFKKAAILDLK